jgi:chromosome partitioning protein
MDVSTLPASSQEPLEEVISVLHTKGGAGKSSLTTNMAYSLSILGYRVLVIDLDRQTGQSVGFGLGSVTFSDREAGADIGAVLRGELPLAAAVIENIYPGLDFLPAEEASLIEAERVLAELGPEGTVRLFEVLHGSEKRWDVVLIDTPGRKTGILEVALAASTGVLIPAIPEGGPVSELTSVLRHVATAREMYGAVEVYGIVRMRVGGNTRYRRLAEEQTKEVAAEFGVPVLKNKVPEDAKFGEAHLAREPIGAYAESARSAIAYRYLADELVALRDWPIRPTSTAIPISPDPQPAPAPKPDKPAPAGQPLGTAAPIPPVPPKLPSATEPSTEPSMEPSEQPQLAPLMPTKPKATAKPGLKHAPRHVRKGGV